MGESSQPMGLRTLDLTTGVMARSANRTEYSDDPELLYMEGASRGAQGDFPGADSCLRRLVDGREDGDHFANP
jgi:hypothetical protein